MKKYILALVTVLLLLTLVPIWAFAHSGGMDSKGGHTDHSTGEYHYHHGYPAHQHPGGKCPYDYDNNTKYNSSSSSKTNSTSSSSSSSKDSNEPLIAIPIITVTISYVILVLLFLEIVDKMPAIPGKITVGVWIASIVISAICLTSLPGVTLITAVSEGVIVWIIWYIIDNKKMAKQQREKNEETSRR